MKLKTDGETVSIETDSHDAETLRAAGTLMKGAVDFIGLFAGDSTASDPSHGPRCEECGSTDGVQEVAVRSRETDETDRKHLCRDHFNELVGQLEAQGGNVSVHEGVSPEEVPGDV